TTQTGGAERTMAQIQRDYWTRTAAAQAELDLGLRQYMLRVYNYMASGLALTGIVAYAVANTPALVQAIFGTPLQWVVMLAPLAFVMVLSFGLNRLSFF